MLSIILTCITVVLLIVVIILLFSLFRKSNDSKVEQMSIEQNTKMDSLNNNVTNMSQLNTAQLQNMQQQLNNVYESIGKIQTMSTDVEQLRKVLANVKQRGVFAEAQLKNILDETIPGMYEQNVKPNPRSDKIVEFAVKIPSATDDSYVYLPIDSKFPLDKYSNLVSASESNNQQYIEECRKALINSIDLEATKIKDKYIVEPYTTPFAVMYLASEGMYLEAIKDSGGLQEKLSRRGIMIAGPSTILALLNSLSLGFNSIQINKNAGEIRKILVNIKLQFQKFDANLAKIETGLTGATKALAASKERARKINNTLERIEAKDEE